MPFGAQVVLRGPERFDLFRPAGEPALLMIGASFPAVLAAAVGGDEAAFAVLWRDLQPALLRYLRVVAAPVAEDLASETWLEVARGLGRFKGEEAGFRAWVFTVARHRMVDWRRWETRHPAAPLPPDAVPELPGLGDAADTALEAISTRAALALIAVLPPDQAEVVTLRVVAGLDVAHVAAIVGKRTGAVRVLCHRGLRRLAELLEGNLAAWRRGGVTK
jgi:RNA polymerase sigma-70 factor (ECF subfamily)